MNVVCLFALCCGAVVLCPASFQDPLITIPVNTWSLVHLLSTHAVTRLYPTLTFGRYWALVVGWELVEQGLVPRLVAGGEFFCETWGDVLGDLLVAIPASLWLD